MTPFILFVVLGYLMGSISSAVIVSRLFSLPDPREEGSKNPGATNVLRLSGKRYAAMVMIADILKGLIPVLLAQVFGATPILVSFVALAAVLGHMYPVFFQFKGGKGVATAIGALLAFNIYIGVLVALTWVLVAHFTRYSSLASMVSIGLAPLYSLLLVQHIGTFPPLFFIALLVLYKHSENIIRLVKGTEHKIKIKRSLLDEMIPDPTPISAHEVLTPIQEKKPAKPKVDKPKAHKVAEVKKPTVKPKKSKTKKEKS